MVVQHNLQAVNANRMLNITTTQQGKSTEKLSSGYRINRAADDAAGLSISEKMRRQIRGLDRASTNAQDGVSAVQTAEGALNEVHDMLQRMNELANQAANGTNSLTDRQAIQDEISQLNTEIDRVSETTKFNELYLMKGAPGTKDIKMKGHDAGLDGTLSDSTETATFTAKLTTDMDVQISGNNYHIYEANDTLDAFKSQVDAASAVTINGTTYSRKSTVTDGTNGTDPVDPATAASVAAKRSSAASKLSSAATKTSAAASLDTSAAALQTSSSTLEASSATLQASVASLQGSAAKLDASSAALETSAATLTASAAKMTTSAATLQASAAALQASAALLTASAELKRASADIKAGSASTLTTAASALRLTAASLTGASAASMVASAALLETSAANLRASAATISGSASAKEASAATKTGSANTKTASARVKDASAATKTASASRKTTSAEAKTASAGVKNASAAVKSASSTIKTASAATKSASADTKTGSADDLRASATTLTQSATTLAASADSMATGSAGTDGTGLTESDVKFVTPDREYLAEEIKAMIVDGAKVGINGAQARTAVDTVNNTNNITLDDAKKNIKYALLQANLVGVDDTTAVSVSDAEQDGDNYKFTINKGGTTVSKDLNFDLHVGADADMTNKIGVNIAVMNSKYLGVQNLQVADDSGIMATYAIDAVEDAIQKVNEQRSALGAVQNRLEHTINNLDNVVENTTAAESRIRDTDIAEEMVTYSKNNILSQAGQSMLAQANQSTQGALSLLG